MLIFMATWYTFTCLTYGTNVPAGLFLPGLIIGCTLGNILMWIVTNFGVFSTDDENYYAIRKKFIILGCGGFMAGYTRMTYSLGVILMETTQDLSLFVPLIFVITLASQTGNMFTRSLNKRSMRAKQLPIITDKIPPPCEDLKAGDIMAENPICLKAVDTVENIKHVLTTTNHHAFPLLNSQGQLVGLIPRNYIIIILQQEMFYSRRPLLRVEQLNNTQQSFIDVLPRLI